MTQYKLVPVKPTEDMLSCIRDHVRDYPRWWEHSYRDMLAAAPQPCAEPDDEIWFEDNNGAMRCRTKDCQRFDANGAPAAVWINHKRYTPDDTALLRQALEFFEHTEVKHPSQIAPRDDLVTAMRERLRN